MKKILLILTVIVMSFLSAMSQPVTLTFTGVDTNNQWSLISRVIVTNVTRDWQETIYYPDTTFVLENNVGIEEGTASSNSELMLNVAPNPFDGVTDAVLTLPEAGSVQLDICDINGRVVVSQTFQSLGTGMHSFRINIEVPQTYFIRASQNNRRVAAKLLNVGRGGENHIEYQGFVKEKYIPVPKYVSTKPYAKGDLMRYVAYVMVCGSLLQTPMVEENLTDSKLITFVVNAKQDAAIVNTGSVGNITTNSADGGGEVVYEGCGYVKQRGVCWDTVNNPTLSNDYTSDGTGLGAFVSHISGLTPHATYFVRAYAINDVGVFYGNEVSFTTDDCKDSIVVTTDSICSGDQYLWHGKVYASGGTYYDSVPKAGGCYWIYELVLNENQSYTVNESDSFCVGSTYLWHGKMLTSAGVYNDTLQSESGCDSIVVLHLTANQNYTVNESDSFCVGSTYLWHGKMLSTAGVYKDTLQSVNGCDSIVILHLTGNQNYAINESDSFCVGNSYLWHGKLLTSAGVYKDTLQSAHGCDSVVTLQLAVIQNYNVSENDSFCSGGNYLWHGKLLTSAGVYRDTLQSVKGCDSVVTLHLTVSQNYNVSENDSFCSGNYYYWHGKMLLTAGVYKDTLQSVSGCDSIVTLYLTENQKYTVNESDSFCTGSLYSWHGQSFAVAGTYYDYMHTIHGCDSIVILHLTNKQSYHFVEKDTITSGSSLVWHGKTLTSAGTYYDSLVASNGCDSIYELDLVVNPQNPTCGPVTDIDGNTYAVVQLGTQCWMAENLRTTRYANGLAIPMGSTETYTNIAYRFYPNKSSSNVSTYGYLYNWRAVMGNSPSSSSNPSGIQGICPTGWHVPSNAEWTTMTNYVSSQTAYQCGMTAIYIAKSLASQSYWSSAGNNGNCYVGDLSYPNNTTGFEARPAGCIYGIELLF